jgi:cAMP-dependent protein kinase regulator
VSSGHLKCTKVINEENKELRDYDEGDVFGELALMYNTPRAATITALDKSVLYSLDRECFNHIVKEATI